MVVTSLLPLLVSGPAFMMSVKTTPIASQVGAAAMKFRPGCVGPRGRPLWCGIGGARPSREPSWEPFAVDCGERPWTSVDSKGRCPSATGPPRTRMDPAWPSTDQEVGCSSRPGRAAEIPCSSRGVRSLGGPPTGARSCWSAFGPREVRLEVEERRGG